MPIAKTPAKAPPASTTKPRSKPPIRAKATVSGSASAKPKPVPSPPNPPVQAAPKPAKVKAKLVRDSFTMPQADFDLIDALKARAIEFKRPAKKSELLRAGLQALSALNDTALRATLDSLAPIKAGRPKKSA